MSYVRQNRTSEEFKDTKKQKHQGDRRFNCAEDNKRYLFANN